MERIKGMIGFQVQLSGVTTGKGTSNMSSLIVRFLKDECGATAIEYGLIAALISVAIISVVTTMGTKLNTTFTSVAGGLK
jgi:pilus assembly protein Flp/PilA